MVTLDLEQAAQFLKLNSQSLRRMAKGGLLPCRKVGKNWLFIEEHLADWVSGRYPESVRELRVIDGGKKEEVRLCPSINVVKIKSGGLTSKQQTAKEYAKALALPTNSKHKNCTTN